MYGLCDQVGHFLGRLCGVLRPHALEEPAPYTHVERGVHTEESSAAHLEMETENERIWYDNGAILKNICIVNVSLPV